MYNVQSRTSEIGFLSRSGVISLLKKRRTVASAIAHGFAVVLNV